LIIKKLFFIKEMKNTNKNKIWLALLLFVSALTANAQVWEVPQADKAKTNPLELTDATKEKGAELYAKNCKSCHGDLGQGNFLPLTPPPADLGSETFKKANTDGDIFYKVTTGRVAMPSFSGTLSEDDRWAIVAYLRAGAETTQTADHANVQLNITADENEKAIVAILTSKDASGAEVNMSGVNVEVFVKRVFGNLLIGKGKTNASGHFKANFPMDLPGDEKGNVKIIAVAAKYKKEATTELNWGKPAKYEKFTEMSSIWGTRANTPWWILLLYIGIGGSVWAFIVYIVLQVFKLAKLGKK